MLYRKNGAANSTHVIYVVDHSGSMAPIWDEMCGALEANLEEVKKAEGDNYVSLIMFDNIIDEVIWRAPVNEVVLHKGAYKPRGSTAMLDAVGIALTKALEEENAFVDEAYYVIIISDGYENSSRAWNYDSMRELVKKCLATDRFTISYIGSNQDLSEVSQQTNFTYGNTLNYVSDRVGTVAMSNSAAVGTQSYFSARAAGKTAVDDLYGDGVDSTGGKTE